MGRSPCCSKPGLKKGPWTPEEDLLLIEYINTHGEGGWSSLPKKAGLSRCGKSCRLRWMNYLRPDVKHGFILPEEADLILRLHRLLGNRWALIAGRIPGRTDNEIKNYWNTHLSKQLISQGIDPRTHKPLAPESLIPPPKPPQHKTKKEPAASNCSRPSPPVIDNNTNLPELSGLMNWHQIDFNCLKSDIGSIRYPMTNTVQTATYVTRDDLTSAPLSGINNIDGTDLVSCLDQQSNLASNGHFQLEEMSDPCQQYHYYSQDLQVQVQEGGSKMLEYAENFGLPSSSDQEVECKFVQGMISSDQYLLQPLAHGDGFTAGSLNESIPCWPNFSNEVALLNYGQEMPFMAFQTHEE